LPNRLGNERLEKPQIQPAALLSRMSSPSVTITRTSGSPPSTGRMITRSMIMPPTNDRTSVSASAPASGRPVWSRPQATKVLNIAISPWAKLTTPVDR
jgi:hypothetical protein